MGSISLLDHRVICRFLAVIGLALVLAGTTQAGVTVEGRVLDIDGKPVGEAKVTLDWGVGAHGAAAVTVFTDEAGKFVFPEAFSKAEAEDLPLQVRAQGFEQLSATSVLEGKRNNKTADFIVVLKRSANQIDTAPASAWLKTIEDPEEKSLFVQQCVSCHQFPASEVRDYANAIHDALGDDETARTQSWDAIVKYMSFLFVEKFAKDKPHIKLDPEQAYGFFRNPWMGEKISKQYPGRMDYIDGYAYGAPLIVTPSTVIKEYEVPKPNSIREAVYWRDQLWVAEVSSNDMIAINPETGEQFHYTVPFDGKLFGPHTLNKGSDDSLWMTSLYNSSLANLSFDEKGKAKWKVWSLRDENMPRGIGIHDITYDFRHEMLADKQDRIWYSNIASEAVGYFNPETGEIRNYLIPKVPERARGRAQTYGAVMESSQKVMWYTQLGIGAFGSFNIETEEFEVQEVLPDVNSGPRRMTISEDDILFVALYGSGQLVEYDTKAKKRIVHDLPDRGSAPYAVTWDPVRKVVWIATANADLIYRFDPATKEYGILPLPRDRGFLRMLQVDPEKGYLVSSYANIPDNAHGRRMALIIEPGDGAYNTNQQLASAED